MTTTTIRNLTFLTLLCLAVPVGAVTVGPGPVIGTDRAGWVFHEEFQDWSRDDLRALDDWDAGGDNLKFWDGHDDGRDLVALYSRREGGTLFLRVDFLDLQAGWQGNLNLHLAIDCAAGGAEWFPDYMDCRTDSPWELCLALYADGDVAGSTYNLYDTGYGTGWNGQFGGSYWSTDLDAVEMALPLSLLSAAGWDGVSPLRFQAATTKDFAEGECSGGGASSDLVDAFVDDDRGCSDGSLDGAVLEGQTAGSVPYATIAHGNQSLNRADELRIHVYDTEAVTGIPGGTGFIRTLDTHRIFDVPLNVHASGTLLSALAWSAAPTGASDPSDGPALLAEIAAFADADQNDRPGALIGGVFAEAIMPYFEGDANLSSMAVADSLHAAMFGPGHLPADMRVMHTPERVIRSLSTGLSPLDGHGFEDILAAGYEATYLDATQHLHHWFYPGESLWPDQPYRHRLHRIGGVLCFFINHREDQYKFWSQDGGLHTETRRSLLDKAIADDHEMVVVFDDWEALAGKSFGAEAGEMVPNDNPIQYQHSIRWLANHPWVEIVSLKDILARADADPAWIIEQGWRYDLDVMSYPWLQHATEDSYHNWYYNSAGGVAGNEQSFYDLVPVIEGEQGDYHARGVGPEADGPPLPSGMIHGDLNTPGTLMHDTWAAIDAAPAGRLRFLAEAAFAAMAYETAWHEEDQTDYSDSDGFGDWLFPDTSWDGHSTWALRLQNHIRDAGALALAAAWADSACAGQLAGATGAYAADPDLDGIDEYVLRNDRVWTLWQERGGRMLLAARRDLAAGDGLLLVGNPLANPSAPGEEEFADGAASRCSGFKVMNGGYADSHFDGAILPGGLAFASGDGQVTLTHALPAGSDTLTTSVGETLGGALYLRLGISPNLGALLRQGPAGLAREHDGPAPESSSWYRLSNAAGGAVTLLYDSAGFVASPLHAGFDRRDLALAEEVELMGDGAFAFRTVLGGVDEGTSAGDASPTATPAVAASLLPPHPNPFNPTTTLRVQVHAAARVELEIVDVAGRALRTLHAGPLVPGLRTFTWDGRDGRGEHQASGLYFARLMADDHVQSEKLLLLK